MGVRQKFVIKITVIFLLFIDINTTMYAQIATPVVDDKHNGTTAVELGTKTTSTLLKSSFTLPFFEKISKVQTFLKKASQLISAVVANLKMTRQLVEEEQRVYELYVWCTQKISNSEGLPDKWKYNKVIIELFRESVKVFEIFELATKGDIAVIDDRGRIALIKEALYRVRKIRRGMHATLRRANNAIFKYRRKKKELEFFRNVFVKQ